MLKALMLSKLSTLLLMFRGRNGKRSIGKIILTIVLFIYACCSFGTMFYSVLSGLTPVLQDADALWLLFSLYMAVCFTLMLLESIFSTKSQLFEAKDNDLLLSMPIPPRYIIASRLLLIYIINLFTELVLFLPLLFNCITSDIKLPVFGWISLCVSAAVLPLLATAVASIFGALLALITKHAKNKSLVTTIISLAFMGAYILIYPRLFNVSPEALLNLKGIFSRIPPTYWFGISVAEGNVLFGLLSLAVAVIPFCICFFVISRSFYGIASDNKNAARTEYREKALKASSPESALLRREFIRLGKTSIYLINETLGIIVSVAGGIAVLIFSGKIYAFAGDVLSGAPDHTFSVFVTLAGCLTGSMIMLTAPSFSLEGKTLWILRTLPVSHKAIIRSKLKLHNFLALPSVLFLVLCASLVLKCSAVDILISAVTVAAFVLTTSEIGLLVDLRFPMLEWDNEAVPVKQNFAVLITMLSGFALIGIPAVIILIAYAWVNVLVLSLCYMVLVCITAAVFYLILMKNGGKMIDKMSK